MGTLVGNTIIGRVQKTLLDETGVSWLAAELLGFMASSFPAIVVMKPNAYTQVRQFQCVAGTLQSLGAQDVALIRVSRNLGVGGATPGRAVTYAGGQEMDRTSPNWHTDPASQVVQNYLYDQRDPKHFSVYPPMSSTPSKIEIITSAIPPRYTDPATVIPLPDEYEDAIYYYMLAMAYAKNAERGDTAKQSAYMAMCRQQLGVESQTETAITPGTPQKNEAP